MSRLRLETERLVLRPPQPKDEAAAIEFYTTDRAQHVGGATGVNFYAWRSVAMIFGHWATRGHGLWAVTEQGNDDIIGLVGPFHPFGWPETEIGWEVFQGYEGRGFAFEAAQAAIIDARKRLGWDQIVHYIAPANIRSIALAERLGAILDPDAQVPYPDTPCLVYRQPKVVG